MTSIRTRLIAAAALFLLAGAAQAQTSTHSVYLDLDRNAGSGCSVVTPAGTVTGAEARVVATVTGTQVTAVVRETCSGGVFGAAQAQPSGYPIGLNVGLGGSDAIEFSTGVSGLPVSGSANLTFASATATGADLVTTIAGVSLPGVIVNNPTVIPATGLIGLLLLIGLMLWLVRRHPKFGSSMGLLLLFGAGVVWAANFVMDGQFGDWAGVSPRAIDASSDSTSGEGSIDIVAVYAEGEAGRLFLRVDVRDAEAQAPTATPQAVTVAEEGSVVITLTGTDPESSPLTFAIATAPTRGTLSAITPVNATSANVTYTGNLNQEGADSFTFTVNDGTSTSSPATVSITITPVNDAPVVAAQTLPVVENSPNGTVVGTATATDVDAGQTQTWAITAGNALGAFAINPATGQITVADTTDIIPANSPFTLTVQATDNGVAPLSGSNTITINVTGVNDEPSFTAGANQTGTEDDPAVSTPWATNILAGPPDENTQTLTFTVTNDNNALFSVQPAIAANGTLTYTLAANANGLATVSVFLSDNGGTAGGGDDTSPTQTFTITIAAVNDAPSFALPASPDQNVLQNSAGASVPNFASAISAGPADESGQTLTFAVSNDNNALFSVQPTIATNGTLSFTPAAGQIGSATVTVTLSDNGVPVGTSAAQTFVINVSDVNDAPSFTVPAAAPPVAEDAGAIVVAGFATALDDNDPTVQTLTFTVGNDNPTLFSAAPVLTVNGAVGDLSYTAAPDASGTATITVTLTDNGGTANGGVDTSAPQTFTITVNAVNDPPTITSPAAFSVPEDTTAVGTVVATDVEASPITFSITGGADAAAFSVNPTTGALSFNAAPNFEAPTDIGANNVYDVEVSASDGSATTPQSIAVTVTNVNEAPVITSSNLVSVPENTTAVTTVTSTDGDGDTVTYTIVGGADQARFAIDANTGVLTFLVAPNFEAPSDSDANNTYVVAVLASDGTTATPQTLTVTVTNVNEAPVFSSPAAFNVVEDTTPVGTAVASDPEGSAVTYSLAGVDAAFFSINPTSGAIVFNTAPDFEMPADAGGDNVYDFTITANDGAVNGTQVVTVTVINTNGAPTFTSPATANAAENQTAVITVTTTDPDLDTITYSVMGGADATLFTIDPNTGVLTFLAPPNFEAPADIGGDNVYNVTVAASDGTAAPTQGLVITVTNVNEAPAFTSPNAFSVPEDTTPVGTVTTVDPEGTASTFSLSGGADLALLSINPTTGALSFNAPPNFEAPADAGADNVYNVVVTASDGTNSPTQAIAISVTNTNDTPVFTSSATPSAAENQTAAVTVVATDGDLDTITYSLTGGVDQALFSINAGSGALTFNTAPNFEAPTDTGANNVYDVVVTASDGTANPTQAIAITVTNVNEAPVITSPNTFSVPENSTPVGTVASTDPEGNAVTYSITAGPDQLLFAINPTTGDLSFVTGPDFEAPTDAGADNVYDVQVTATDGSLPTSQNIAVTVTNLNEGPTFTSANVGSVPENTAGTAFTAVAVDGEGDTVSYAITGGADQADLTINPSSGAISFNVAPNFEAPVDSDSNNSYVIDLTASSTGGTAMQTLTLTVTDVNEAPVITSPAPPASVPENTAGTFHTVTATDPDGTAPTFALVAGGDSADFAINPTTGALSFAVAPNFEAPADANTDNVYQVTVRATDGALFDDEPYSITVTNVNEAPTAVADAYDYLGNIELRIAGHAGSANALSFTVDVDSLIANDTDPDSLASGFANLATVAVPPTETGTGSVYSIAVDGTMTYTPGAGDTAPENIPYQLTDGANTVGGTITFTRAGTDMVWFVRNNDPTADAFTGNNGTSSDPFNTLVEAQTASAADHIVYVHVGDGAVTGQNAGIVLKNGQDLIGNGVALSANGGATTIAAGAQPQIGNAAGIGVSAPNLIGTVAIRGLNIGSTGANNDGVLATTTASAGVTLDISDNTIRGTGTTAQGIDVEVGSGTVNLSLHDNIVTSTGTGFELTRTAGTFTITAFDDNVATGAVGSHGIDINTAVFDATPGGGFQQVSGGTTAVGVLGDRVTNIGVRMQNVTGDLSFTNLTVFNNNGNGLQASGVGVFNAGAGTGFRIASTGAADIIESNGGAGVSISNATISLALSRMTVTGGGTNSLNLDTVAGTFSAGAASSIVSTAAGATAYRIINSSVNATYNGTITATNSTGVSLTTNTGTMAFTGALTLNTAANPAFTATTGGGTVTATNTTSTLTTTTGTALNVANTNIGLSGLTFRSINSNGAASGIILNTTGTTAGTHGGLTVTGTGSDDSGGSIVNSTQDGVFLNSTRSITLTEMVINNSGQSQIDASTVVGLTLTGIETDDSGADGILGSMITNLTISGSVFARGGDNAGFANVDGIFITNLRGTSSVTNTTFSNSNTIQMFVLNNTATVAAPAEPTDVLTVSGTTWNNHTGPFAGDHLSVSADTGGNFKLIVDSSVGINNFTTGGIGVQATSAGSGTMKALVTGVNAVGPMTAGVVIGATASGNTKFDIFENKTANGTGFTGMGSLSIAVTCITSGTCNGFIRDNRIIHTAGPGVDAFHAILQGNGTLNAEVMQNVVSGNFQRGFNAESGVGTGANARVNLKFNNNTLTGTANAAAGALQGVNLQTGNSGGGPDNKMCLDMFSNTVTMVDTTAYRLRNEITAGTCAGCVFQLKNYAGGGTDTAAISAWITGAPNSNTFSTASGVPISIGTNNPYSNAGASCPAPSI